MSEGAKLREMIGTAGVNEAVSRVSRHVTVQNHAGLHARASLEVLKEVKRFSSRVYLVRGRERAAANNMLQLLCLGAPEGTELVVEAEGPDAADAVAAMVALFDMKFYEDDMEGMRPPE